MQAHVWQLSSGIEGFAQAGSQAPNATADVAADAFQAMRLNASPGARRRALRHWMSACVTVMAIVVSLWPLAEAQAAPPATSNGPVTAAQIPPHLPFYIARKANNRTVYILGTMHAAMPADYPPNLPFRPAILDALKHASLLAFELSPDDLVVSQNDVTRYGVCPNACLSKQLPDALWKRLQWRLRDNPEALDEIQKMRPWLAALLIETYDSLASGLQTEYGTEAQLENIYAKYPIVGLETLNDQMRAFTNLRPAEQWEMLAQDLAQTPQQNAADMRQLHALWREGDADKLAAWSAARSQRLAQTPDLSNALDEKVLYRRNRHFARRIADLSLPDKPLFVAVGVLHLGGPRGVLAKLRENGFTVQPG
ncbi:TraB/GumN family protein [Pararobbsia alpina]